MKKEYARYIGFSLMGFGLVYFVLANKMIDSVVGLFPFVMGVLLWIQNR